MSDTTTTGRRLCGAVSLRLAEAPDGHGACHCGMCRRWSGGIELGIMVKPGGVTSAGEDKIRTYNSFDWAERGVCAVGGSNLFWRLTAPGDMRDLMRGPAGAVDSLEELKLTSEIYIDHKPAGHTFSGERTRMTEAEVLATAGIGTEGATT